jgi:hypothetical protein
MKNRYHQEKKSPRKDPQNCIIPLLYFNTPPQTANFRVMIGIWVFLKEVCGVGHVVPLPDLVLDTF